MDRIIVLAPLQHPERSSRKSTSMDWRGTLARPAAHWARFGGMALLGAVVAAGLAILTDPAGRARLRSGDRAARRRVRLARDLAQHGRQRLDDARRPSGGTVAGALATPVASALLWSLVVLGALALYWLQRLLGPEEG